MAQRYETRKEPDGTWAVVDRFTGQPARLGPRTELLTGLEMEQANTLLELLNLLDRDRGGER